MTAERGPRLPLKSTPGRQRDPRLQTEYPQEEAAGTSRSADPGTPTGPEEGDEGGEEEDRRKGGSEADQRARKGESAGAGTLSAGPRKAEDVARDVFGDSDSEEGGEEGRKRGRGRKGRKGGVHIRRRLPKPALAREPWGMCLGIQTKRRGERGGERRGWTEGGSLSAGGGRGGGGRMAGPGGWR